MASLQALIETPLLQPWFRLIALQLTVPIACLLHLVFAFAGHGVGATCCTLCGRLMGTLGVTDETVFGLLAFLSFKGALLHRTTLLFVLQTFVGETAFYSLLLALVFHHTPVDRLSALFPVVAVIVAHLFSATSLAWLTIAFTAPHESLVLLQAACSTLLFAKGIFYAGFLTL